LKYSERAETFKQAKDRYTKFLASVLWKLTGDRELFTDAMQYALLGMWQHVEKLNGKKAGAYIYRIALSGASKAWRDRVGRDGEISKSQIGVDKSPDEKVDMMELVTMVRQAVSQLPAKQARAVVMRYLEQQDYGSIAAELSCTEAGARSHVSKAIATLKRKLATVAKMG